MPEISRVNWVVCPKCKFRYYIAAPLLRVEGIPALCPKCHYEFDPRPHLESKFTAITARQWYG